VGAVPAGEGIINRLGELSEGVAAGGREDPAGAWPEVLATSLDEIDADGQPGAAHAQIVSDGRGFQRVGGVVGELFGALQAPPRRSDAAPRRCGTQDRHPKFNSGRDILRWRLVLREELNPSLAGSTVLPTAGRAAEHGGGAGDDPLV
jgi:hypothetical protein